MLSAMLVRLKQNEATIICIAYVIRRFDTITILAYESTRGHAQSRLSLSTQMANIRQTVMKLNPAGGDVTINRRPFLLEKRVNELPEVLGVCLVVQNVVVMVDNRLKLLLVICLAKL